MGLKQRPKYESSEDDQDAMKVDDSSDEDESLAVRAARLKENAGATERSSVAQDDSRREGAADARTKESKIADESSPTPAVKKSTAAKKAPRKASEAKAKPKKAAGHRQAAKAKTANATAVQKESDSEDEPLTTALHKKGGILSGKTFVLSDAYGLDDADDMHEMVKQHAGRISDALSKVRLADAVATHLFRPLHAHS